MTAETITALNNIADNMENFGVPQISDLYGVSPEQDAKLFWLGHTISSTVLAIREQADNL